MRQPYSLIGIALMGATVVIGSITVHPVSALAAKNSRSTVMLSAASDPIKDATVNLYCRLKSGKKIMSSSGSGVFIHERGVILTNAHVAQYFFLAADKGLVKGWCSVRTGSPAEETYTAEILYYPTAWLTENSTLISQKQPKGTGEHDFALLYVTKAEKGALPERFPYLPLGSLENVEIDDTVTVAGYPTESLSFSGIRNKLSHILASSTILSMHTFSKNQTSFDILTLSSSPASAAGISGGPIVTSTTAVIGIVTTKSATKGKSTLRGITIPYINASILAQTGLTLPQLLVTDYATRAALTRSGISPDIITELSNGLRKK